METTDSNASREESPTSTGQPADTPNKNQIVKVHIGDETFYCKPLPLKNNSRFFARALEAPLTEIPLPTTEVSAGAFCALYGWLSGDNTPYATHRALEEVPLAAAYLGVTKPMDNFWVHTHFHQLQKIKERIENGGQ